MDFLLSPFCKKLDSVVVYLCSHERQRMSLKFASENVVIATVKVDKYNNKCN